MHNTPIGGPGRGLWPDEIIVSCTFTEAATANDCVQLDLAQTAATGTAPGDSTPFSTVRDPDTGAAPLTGLEQGIFGVALETVAAGGVGKVMFYGLTTCNVDGSTAVGEFLLPAADGQLDRGTGATGLKVVAIAMEADTANVAACWFNGFGWGQDGSEDT